MMTNGRLAGHSVLVTGASSGIGLGIARKMAEEGAAVGINYRSHQEPAEAIRKAGDAYNRTRLTPFLRALSRRWLTWTR